MKKNGKNIRAVLGGALLTGVSTGIFSNAAAVFILPVCSDLGMSRSSFALVSSIALIFSMAALPLYGSILPKANLKRLIALSAAVCSGCVWGYSFCSDRWQFYLLAAAYGIFVNGSTLLTVAVMLRRLSLNVGGMVSGAAFAAAGVFSFLFLPRLQKAVDLYGWRYGYRFQAAVGAAILLAALLIMPNTEPQPQGERSKEKTLSLFRGCNFIKAATGLFIANAVNLALFNHSAANLKAAGISAAMAADVTARAALFSSAAKPLFGLAADKLGIKAAVLILGGSLLATSAAAIMPIQLSSSAVIFSLLLAVCACANSLPAQAFAEKLAPKRQFSSATAALTFASTAGSAVGPLLAGLVFDRFGSYAPMWCGCAAAAVIAVFLMQSAANDKN